MADRSFDMKKCIKMLLDSILKPRSRYFEKVKETLIEKIYTIKIKKLP